MLTVAGFILILTGIAHSYLGEKYILIRLFKRGSLPKLLGGETFTRNTLRFAWHITTITWFGIAAVLFSENGHTPYFLYMVTIIFFISAATAAFFSRGKHLSWIAFLIIGILTLWAS